MGFCSVSAGYCVWLVTAVFDLCRDPGGLLPTSIPITTRTASTAAAAVDAAAVGDGDAADAGAGDDEDDFAAWHLPAPGPATSVHCSSFMRAPPLHETPHCCILR